MKPCSECTGKFISPDKIKAYFSNLASIRKKVKSGQKVELLARIIAAETSVTVDERQPQFQLVSKVLIKLD